MGKKEVNSVSFSRQQSDNKMSKKMWVWGKQELIHIACICIEYLWKEMQKAANIGCLQKEQVAGRGT